MPTTFRPYEPDQMLLLAPSLRDWLPEGHLADHVSDLVEGLDLTAFYERYEGEGRRKSPYEPRMLLKVLIYGYATGVFSSRKLARKLNTGLSSARTPQLRATPKLVSTGPVSTGRDSFGRICYVAATIALWSRQPTRTSVKVFLSYTHTDAILAERVRKALTDNGLEVSDPRRDHMPGDNWADEVARALEESEAMVVLLTPGPMSPEVKRNIEYALGSKNYSNRLIPVVVGDPKNFPTTVIPWIVRRMPRFELRDTEPPKVDQIAKAILSHA